MKAPGVLERYIAEYWHDAENLKIRKATFHPRATEHIEDIIALIKILERERLYL